MGLPGDKHEQIGPPHDKPKSRGTAKRLWHKLKGKDDEADTASTNPIAEPPSTFVQKSPDNIPNIGAAKSKLAKGKDVLNGPTSLWDSAYDALKSANPALVEKYEALLSKQSRAVASEQTERSSHWRPERIENSVKSASNQIDNNLRPSGSASDGQPGQAKDTLNDINNQIKNDLTPSGSGSIDQASAPDDLKGVNSQINNLCISDRRALLTSVAKAGLERLEKKKIRYQIVSENCLEDAGHEFVLQDQIAGAVGVLDWAKEWIGEAVEASPQASAVWAGVCIILPLLTKPIAAEQANRDGFAYVTTRMRYYVALEPLILPQRRGIGSTPVASATTRYAEAQVQEEIKALILDLYQHILEFQFRSILRFYRHAFYALAQDVVTEVDWEALKTNIVELETQVRNDSAQESSLASRDELTKISSSATESLNTIRQFLSTAQEHLEVGKEQRDIASNQLSVEEEQLQVQKMIAKKMFTQDEEKCHQLFRLDGGDGYEYYKDHISDRVKGTCEWFLNHDSFIEWLRKESGLLLVSADPGCGKSVLAKYLVEVGLPRSATICYFFFKDQLQNTLKRALCALLHQLFSQKPHLICHAMSQYSQNGSKLVEVISVLWDILAEASQDVEAGPVIFVLDALDECVISDFLDMTRMLKQRFLDKRVTEGQVKFLLTSHPYDHIISQFQGLIKMSPRVHIPADEESETISEEINLVIQYRVGELAEAKNLKPHLSEYLERRLLEVEHRTYLWIYLVFDYLESEGFKKTEKGIEASLQTLPKDVNEAYEKISSKSKDDEKVRLVLAIILAAVRPLTLVEINIAVHARSATSHDDLDLEDEEDFRKTLRNWCGLFVNVYNGKVEFLHQTAREFLLQKSSKASEQSWRWHGSMSIAQAHGTLVEACATYLDFPDLDIEGPSDEDDFNKEIGEKIKTYFSDIADTRPFFEYSSLFWPDHFQRANLNKEAGVIRSALTLCAVKDDSFQAWFQAGLMWYDKDSMFSRYSQGWNKLFVASYLGLDPIVEILLQQNLDVNAADNMGRTPLFPATYKEHLRVVRLLLDGGADPNNASYMNFFSYSPLELAAEFGYTAIAALLLDKGASLDGDGVDPMSKAIMADKVDIVILFLDRGLDVNSRTSLRQIPLLTYAARHSRKEIFDILIDRGADVNAVCNSDDTPLNQAASWGGPDMIRQLIGRGARLDVRDTEGQTPLHISAGAGKVKNTRILLELGADSRVRDNNGKTPRALAIEKKREELIELFAEKGIQE